MRLEIEELGPVERRLCIEIPTAEVDAAFDEVYRELQRGAKIPGFRAGKVPRSVVARYFGERARGEVLERLVRESLSRALKDAELAVVGEPRLDPGEPPQEGVPFSYAATLDIRPAIELEKVHGLELAVPELAEPEQDPVEQHLEELRVQQAQLVEEAEHVAAARGHLAAIDYDASVEGKPFQGGSGRDTVLELGEGRAIPGLEDELLGMRAGEERDFELSLPDTYPEQAVAGKRAAFHVKLVGLKRRELAALDDEFAKDVSEFETLEELTTDLRRRVQEGRDAQRRELQREAVVDAALEANPFPVPPSLVERQLANRIARAADQLRRLPQEELAKLVEKWREEWRPRAERDVRFALLVPEIAKAEGIEVPDEDVDARLKSLAEREGRPLSQLKRAYRERGLLDAVRSGLLEERVVDFLLSRATLSGS